MIQSNPALSSKPQVNRVFLTLTKHSNCIDTPTLLCTQAVHPLQPIAKPMWATMAHRCTCYQSTHISLQSVRSCRHDHVSTQAQNHRQATNSAKLNRNAPQRGSITCCCPQHLKVIAQSSPWYASFMHMDLCGWHWYKATT